MSVTIGKTLRDNNPASLRWGVTLITGDSSYPTGGYPVTAQDLGMVDYVIHTATTMNVPGASVVFAHYDKPNAKIQFFTVSGEVANGTNVAAVVCSVMSFGI